jgi:hypothetical protein
MYVYPTMWLSHHVALRSHGHSTMYLCGNVASIPWHHLITCISCHVALWPSGHTICIGTIWPSHCCIMWMSHNWWRLSWATIRKAWSKFVNLSCAWVPWMLWCDQFYHTPSFACSVKSNVGNKWQMIHGSRPEPMISGHDPECMICGIQNIMFHFLVAPAPVHHLHSCMAFCMPLLLKCMLYIFSPRDNAMDLLLLSSSIVALQWSATKLHICPALSPLAFRPAPTLEAERRPGHDRILLGKTKWAHGTGSCSSSPHL